MTNQICHTSVQGSHQQYPIIPDESMQGQTYDKVWFGTWGLVMNEPACNQKFVFMWQFSEQNQT